MLIYLLISYFLGLLKGLREDKSLHCKAISGQVMVDRPYHPSNQTA